MKYSYIVKIYILFHQNKTTEISTIHLYFSSSTHKKSKNAEKPTKQIFFSLQRKKSDTSSSPSLLDKDDDDEDPSADVYEEEEDDDPSADVDEEDESLDEVTVEAIVKKKRKIKIPVVSHS